MTKVCTKNCKRERSRKAQVDVAKAKRDSDINIDKLNWLNREEDEARQRLENTNRENEQNESLITNLTDQVERVEERLPLRVLSAVGVVLGIVLSNLKSVLSKVEKGLGDESKAIGKKLGEIPGIVGAIAVVLSSRQPVKLFLFSINMHGY